MPLAGQLLGGGHAGDAAADHKGRAVRKVRRRGRSLWYRARATAPSTILQRLLLGALGSSWCTNEHPSRMLAKATAFSPRRRSRAMRSKVGPWKRGEQLAIDEVVEPALLHGGRDIVALSAAHELIDGDGRDALEVLACAASAVEVDDAADVAAALAEEDAGPHRAPAFCRAPMRSRKGSTFWECGLDADILLGVGAERQREELLHVQVHERVLLAGARRDDVVVAVELHVAVRAHVHEHVDLLLGETAELLLGHGDRDRRVHETVGGSPRRSAVVFSL